MPKTRLLFILMAALAVPAFAADAPIDGLARTCNNCHGVDGISAGSPMPSIGGQSADYLKNIMMQWKNGDRAAATMSRLIKGYSDEQIAALAKYYADKPWKPQPQKMSAAVHKKGREVIDPCETCHGDTGGKPDDEMTPRLNGQWAGYLELELMKYRDDGVKMPHKKMIKNARKLKEDDVAVASEFFAGQK